MNITRRPEKAIDSSSLSILYLLLVHQSPDFVFRLMTALNESQHTFVIHVDLKVSYSALLALIITISFPL